MTLGDFSEEALLLFQHAAAAQSYEFSEGDTYDFTRCVRPDGSAYGTGGKCRQGTEGEAKKPESKAAPRRGNRNSAKPTTAKKPAVKASPAVIAKEEAKLARLKAREAAAEEKLSTARGARMMASARSGTMIRTARESRANAAADRAAGKASEISMQRIEQERKLNELKGIKPKVEKPQPKTKETVRREKLSKLETSINSRAKRIIEKYGNNSPEYNKFVAKYGATLGRVQDEKQTLIGK
jgi:pyruvate/2-oxoglutarate dehydrogenase complex dihydrolipoamide acyltransferase (E2) component